MAARHSYGPGCAFHDPTEGAFNPDSDVIPNVKAQFFYVSALPIDDPLSPLPPIQTDKTTKHPPKPFSVRDNADLERAWRALQDDVKEEPLNDRPGSRGLHRMFSFPKFQSAATRSPGILSPTAEISDQQAFGLTSDLSSAGLASSGSPQTVRRISSRSQSPRVTRKGSDRTIGHRSTATVAAESEVLLSQERSTRSSDKPLDPEELESGSSMSGSVRQYRHSSPLRQRRKSGKYAGMSSPSVDDVRRIEKDISVDTNIHSAPTAMASDLNMSGRPFARAPSTRQIQTYPEEEEDLYGDRDRHSSRSQEGNSKTAGDDDDKVFVSVGISRLHLVEFPDLKMKPIYWSPINDTSTVLRATWFYKDTMLPVSAEVANRLEIGYEEIRPYTTSYQDELNACVEHGAAAELKIVRRLWPEVDASSRPATAVENKPDGEVDDGLPEVLPAERYNAAVDARKPGKKTLFQSYSVIYADDRNAQILRPNALPSASRGRKPLGSIRKGRQLGIAVVRGFDREIWLKPHPDPKNDAGTTQAQATPYVSQSGDATLRRQRSCHACQEDDDKPQVSDLVLVVHGIGQKLSERVDSYHFTHAVNGLRREFNIEISNVAVQNSLKVGSGIMVLPVNWRLTVSLGEDGKLAEVNTTQNKYTLKDITPDSLPSVRSLFNDVILDIPFYLSYQKEKMIAAVIREANRVYRLWCKNNPGFQQNGRVHLIAHSLGSAMAMDILSQQPTKLPEDLDLSVGSPSEKMFEFDTANLFCCGSPSGLFLLLNRANLVPRQGRRKPGMESDDCGQGVAGEAGKYGCLAVDNLYNILHKNDPVAYHQNACVDINYAASLRTAVIPSATQSIFVRVGQSLRWASASAVDAYGHVAPPTRRPAMPAMPSTVELETHDFTQEEIAEKRMYLLNENGQIDYFLRAGDGPLEYQYFNMLSAHSSYWYLQDFVRFVVVEIGRRPGREHTLPVLRAVKKREYRRGAL